MLVSMWLLGLPWYFDLGASIVVALLCWFVVGIWARASEEPRKIGYKIKYVASTDYHGYPTYDYRALEDQAAADEEHKNRVLEKSIAWAATTGGITAVFWPAVPALVIAAAVLFGAGACVYWMGKGSILAGNKVGGIKDTRKKQKAELKALAARAEKENQEWLAAKIKEVKDEFSKLEDSRA